MMKANLAKGSKLMRRGLAGCLVAFILSLLGCIFVRANSESGNKADGGATTCLPKSSVENLHKNSKEASSVKNKLLTNASKQNAPAESRPHSLNLKSKVPKEMVLIPENTFWMGCEDGAFIDTKPVHQVHLDSFLIDKTEVTNDEYARFAKATGYKTVAERKPDQKDFPGAPPENLIAGALVFTPPAKPVPLNSHYNWWRYVHGANWMHPEGPQSDIKARGKYPVVQIAFEDAEAYAKWEKKRLPTEAEFECAARGGLDRKTYGWGNELKPKGKWQANIWQGVFPSKNTREDGFEGTAPVASFPPNNFGLYDTTGNVWEWCSDWYRSDYYGSLPSGKLQTNLQGPHDSFDKIEPGVSKRVLRGGSFLCTDQYCARYMVGARGKGEISSGCSNIGFRCARNL